LLNVHNNEINTLPRCDHRTRAFAQNQGSDGYYIVHAVATTSSTQTKHPHRRDKQSIHKAKAFFSTIACRSFLL
jgi:hypothetical protein